VLLMLLLQTVLFLHRTLHAEGYRVVMLHGKRSQAERSAAVADFKSGKAQVRAA
jgi:superfamily II DNA/RNA helicase